MKRLIVAIALAATAVSAQAAAAERDLGNQPDLSREQARQRADQLFQSFDLNNDGVVTRTEAEQIGKQLMMQRAETGVDVAPGLGGHTLRFLERAFAGAQSISQEQFEQAMLAHFDQMDANHDGILTANERLQGRLGRGGSQ